MASWRDRIRKHVRVRAGDLVPHEMNPRQHPDFQRRALEALYEQVGFARSLLAFEMPDGRYKLIDGHLRASMNPEQEVSVEVLDVSEDEARVLLLSLDPLAALAENDATLLDELRAKTTSDSEVLTQLWEQIKAGQSAVEERLREAQSEGESSSAKPPAEQYLILIECTSESEQYDLLERLQAEGIVCKPLIS